MPRILLVDDDRLLRSALARVLVRSGYEITSASSVREAIRTFESETFDLVVTDVYMPDEDGLDLLRQIRASSSNVPVIALSGQFTTDFGGTLEMVFQSFGAKTLGKGGDLSEVVSAVRQLVPSQPKDVLPRT